MTLRKQRPAWVKLVHSAALGVGLTIGAAGVTAGAARADAVDQIGKRLIAIDAETKELVSGIVRPTANMQATDLQARRLVDAQVAFAVGNFDDAALMLYDYVAKNPGGRSFDEALYYLAEALFQKGDFVASRSYFTQLLADVGASSKFYQQSLERLIELSLKLRDGEGVNDWLAALDRVPAAQRRASVPYVRGKYAYYSDSFDEALSFFQKVSADSEYAFQARYFAGTCYVAKKDLANAAKAFDELVKAEPKTDEDRRVIELAYMAIGRLHYERDQPSKAIDSYLQVDRRSDLFDDALYEVAWVYVKNKAFDKALRALELLSLSDPNSARMPTVRLLEGSLRIRKAQQLADENKGNPNEEYDKATEIFGNTKASFTAPFAALQKFVADNEDPQAFLAQITGRQSETFDTNSTMPEIAAAWLREEGDVQRVVAIETDLGQIRDEIAESDKVILRLEQALESQSRVNIFPSLAIKRTRGTEILEEIFELRQQLATHERARITPAANASEKAELDRLQAARQQIARDLAALPNAEMAYGKRVEEARNNFDKLDQTASEIQVIIDSTDATLIATQKYLADQGDKEAATANATLIAELGKETKELRHELELVRREALLAKDQAGTGDDVAVRARELRVQLREALENEHRALAAIASRLSGNDRAKADQIGSLTNTANSAAQRIDQANVAIDEIVDVALTEVRSSLDEEKARLGAYRREFLTYEAESRALGGTVLSGAFIEVKAKFYDILVRSDIGVIDVAWSQKEAVDEASKRLTLDKQRELKTLREDFRELVQEAEREKAGQ